MATVDADGLIAGLEAWAKKVHPATRAGVESGGYQLQNQIRDALSASEYPPASEPGTPPALRSGALRDSVRLRLVEISEGYQARVYPSTVYARIHELSGWAGKDHRSFLPKRPYVGPTLQRFAPDFRAVMVDAWRGAQPGR